MSFSVDPSVIKNPRDTEQHEENHMSCISVQNALFHGIHWSCTENMVRDTEESLFNGSFLQFWKKLLSGCSSHLVNCIGNSKIIHPSVIYFSSPNALQRLSSFNSQHSLQIKTYCVPSRVPSTTPLNRNSGTPYM